MYLVYSFSKNYKRKIAVANIKNFKETKYLSKSTCRNCQLLLSLKEHFGHTKCIFIFILCFNRKYISYRFNIKIYNYRYFESVDSKIDQQYIISNSAADIERKREILLIMFNQ